MCQTISPCDGYRTNLVSARLQRRTQIMTRSDFEQDEIQ
jgi:hypothetical protein